MTETPSELQGEVEKLERRHAEDPGGRYFVPLANAYRRLGRHQEAESLLRDGLRRHPEYLSAHIVLGRCLADQGRVEAAAEEFRHVLSVDPQNLVALRSLGEISLSGGRTEEAGRWYRELLAVDPMNEEARRALDSLDRLSGPADLPSPPEEHAPEEYGLEEPAPESEEEVELVTETIAELYARQGLYDRSVDVYRELIRRRGGDAGLERRLAEVLRQAGRGEAPPAADHPEPAIPVEEAPAETGRGERTIAEFLAELASWRRDAEVPAAPDTDGAALLPLLDSAPPASAPVATGAEDDDLESFQAWLRSLKR